MGLAGTNSRALTWVSAGIAALTTAAYLALITAEGNNPFWDVFPWAALMLVGTGAAAVAAISPSADNHKTFAIAATVILGLIGFISMFSVGVGFLAAAAVGGVAAGQAQTTGRSGQR